MLERTTTHRKRPPSMYQQASLVNKWRAPSDCSRSRRSVTNRVPSAIGTGAKGGGSAQSFTHSN